MQSIYQVANPTASLLPAAGRVPRSVVLFKKEVLLRTDSDNTICSCLRTRVMSADSEVGIPPVLADTSNVLSNLKRPRSPSS